LPDVLRLIDTQFFGPVAVVNLDERIAGPVIVVVRAPPKEDFVAAFPGKVGAPGGHGHFIEQRRPTGAVEIVATGHTGMPDASHFKSGSAMAVVDNHRPFLLRSRAIDVILDYDIARHPVRNPHPATK